MFRAALEIEVWWKHYLDTNGTKIPMSMLHERKDASTVSRYLARPWAVEGRVGRTENSYAPCQANEAPTVPLCGGRKAALGLDGKSLVE